MLDEKFLERLDAMRLRMRHPTAGGGGGLRKSKALGSSVEFSDFREYTHGDDIRRLDWNAYARFDKLFLKQFMEEQEASIHIIVDASASMAFGEPTKWEAAVNLAQILCYLALVSNDRATLYALQGNSNSHTRPLTGRQGYVKVAEFLKNLAPKGKTDLASAVASLPLSQGRGKAVLLSDFLDPGGYESALQSLRYRKQEVSALQLLCREELEPSMEDAVQLVDSETGATMEILASYDMLKRYRRTVKGFLEGLRRFCSRHGISYAMLRAEDPLENVLLRELSRVGLLQG